MKLTITQPAMKWFINEMQVEDGDYIRFYVRYGGVSNVHPGFSIGMSKQDTPYDPAIYKEIGGIMFFIEKKDQWYFERGLLHIKYSRKRDEIEFMTTQN